jgi:hypothetical protein
MELGLGVASPAKGDVSLKTSFFCLANVLSNRIAVNQSTLFQNIFS